MSFWDIAFEDGNVDTIIGRPKVGKTNLAVDLGFKAIEHGFNVLSNIIFFKPQNMEKAKEKGWLSEDIDYKAVPDKFKYVPIASQLVLEASLHENNIIILDETGMIASAYKALSNTSVQMRYLGYSIRKIGGCLIILAQTKGSVVPDLREELVNYEIHIKRELEGTRTLEILKRNEFFNPEKKEYDIEFLPYDVLQDIPRANIPFDTKSTAGFIWDLNLPDIYHEIILQGYDAIEVREHLPDIVRNLVAEKRMDEFMKRKKFMRTGSVAELFKVTPETIRTWVNEGKFNAIKEGAHYFFSRSEMTKKAKEMGFL